MFHQLTASINDVLWVIDAETMALHYVSSSVYTMLGYTTEEVIGKRFDENIATTLIELIRSKED